jgi:hypothetical protein
MADESVVEIIATDIEPATLVAHKLNQSSAGSVAIIATGGAFFRRLDHRLLISNLQLLLLIV